MFVIVYRYLGSPLPVPPNCGMTQSYLRLGNPPGPAVCANRSFLSTESLSRSLSESVKTVSKLYRLVFRSGDDYTP